MWGMLRMLASVEAVKPLISALAACPHNACLFPHRDFRIILPLGGKTRGWEKSSNSLVENALRESSSFDGKWTSHPEHLSFWELHACDGCSPPISLLSFEPSDFSLYAKGCCPWKELCRYFSLHCRWVLCILSLKGLFCFLSKQMCYLKTLFYENYLIKEKHS